MNNILVFYNKYSTSIRDTFNGTLGYLVPSIENGKMVERTFVDSATASLKRTRPSAYIEIDSETGVLLFYKHCMYEDFVNTEEFPPGTPVSNKFETERTVKEQIEFDKALWELYKDLRTFAFEENLTEDQLKTVREYKEMWNKTVLCDLKQYYEALSPDFFNWLNDKA